MRPCLARGIPRRPPLPRAHLVLRARRFSDATPRASPAAPPPAAKWPSKYRDIGYSEARKEKAPYDLVIMTQRMKSFFISGDFRRAEQVIKEAKLAFNQLDEHFWATQLNGWADNGRIDKVREVIAEMQKLGVPVHLQAWGVLLKALIMVGKQSDAITLLEQLEQSGPHPDLITYNLVLTQLARGALTPAATARIVFENLKKVATPDVISYRGIISCEAQEGHFDNVTKLVREMQRNNLPLGLTTFTPIIKAAFFYRRLDLVETYRAELGDATPDLPLGTVLIRGYLKGKDRERLYEVIDTMRQAHTLDGKFYLMIAEAYYKNGAHSMIMDLREEMMRKRVRPEDGRLPHMMLELAVNSLPVDQCLKTLHRMWENVWPVNPSSAMLVAEKFKKEGNVADYEQLKQSTEVRELRRQSRRERRHIVKENAGKPLYEPKIPSQIGAPSSQLGRVGDKV